MTSCNLDRVGDKSPSAGSSIDALRSFKLRALYVPPSILSMADLVLGGLRFYLGVSERVIHAATATRSRLGYLNSSE